MKNFYKKSLKVCLSAGIALTSFISQGAIVSAHPSDDIVLPGGSGYSDYTVKKDSPVSGDYAQSASQTRRIFNPIGEYISSADLTWPGGSADGSIVQDQITKIQKVSDGYLFINNTKSTTGTTSQAKIVKTDLNFNIINTVMPLGARQYIGLSFFANQDPNAGTYYLITDSNLKIAVDKDGNLVTPETSLGLPTTSPVPGSAQSGSLIPNSSGWASFAVGSPNHGPVTAYKLNPDGSYSGTYKELDIPWDSGTTWFGATFTPLDNGNILATLGTNGPMNQALVLYDGNLNVINVIATGTNGYQNYKALSETSSGNYIVRDYGQSVDTLTLMEVDKTTGNIVKSVDYSGSGTTMDVAMSLTNPAQDEKYFISGKTNPSGKFAGFATTAGAYIASFDEDLSLINANMIDSNVDHVFAGVQDLGNGNILAFGYTRSGGDIFDTPTPLYGSYEGFIGTFEQTIDFAPKLPTFDYLNVRINSGATAAEVDSALLAAVEKKMKNGTNDIENNKLDDFTTNAELLGRINKNVLNTDYANTTIDWSKFGLTPISGKNTYEVGPSANVTYSVTDTSMLQTTTSTLVNVMDENTLTDTEPNPEDANYALRAQDIRVHVNDVAALNYLTAANVKAWNLETGVVETNSVVVGNSSVQAKVGVYNATYSYQGIVKTNKVIVYDDNTKFGPTVDDPNDESNTEMLYAIGGNYLPSAVSGKTLDQVTGFAAWDLTTGAAITTKTTVVKDENNATVIYDGSQAGDYYVTYTLAGGTTKTVLVKITTGNIPVMTINPQNVNLALNAAAPNVMTGVSATDVEDLDLTAAITNTGSVNTAAKGVYTINYSVTDNDNNTVTGFRKYLVDYVNPPISANNEAIVADSFELSVAEANALTENDAITRAGAKAWSLTDGADVAITQTDISQVQGAKGVYDVTFATANGTSITIKAIVDYVNPPIAGQDETIIADDFKLSLAEAAALTEGDAIIRAGAKAWEHGTGSDVVITTTDISAVQTAKGVYDVTFATAKGTTITVKAIVDYSNPPIAGQEETIIADDFRLTVAEAAALTEADAAVRAGVKAWVQGTGSDVAIATTDISAVQAVKGVYDVTFATAKGTTITVKAVVDYTNPPIAGNEETIVADDFQLTVAEAGALTEAQAVTLAKAKAWVQGTGSDVAITATDISAVQAAKGVYDVTFSTAKGTTITVKAIVDYNNPPIAGDKETIIADDFTLSLAEAAALTEAEAVTRAGAKAWEQGTGTDVTITTIDISAVQAAKGIYDVTFATTKGTTITIKAIVDYTNPPIAGDKETIIADDFNITTDEAAALTQTQAIQLAGAKAWEHGTGLDVAITSVDISAVQASVGVYDVSFATIKGTTTTVKAVVGYTRPPVINDDESIVANDFSLTPDQASNLTQAEAITFAQAKAWLLGSGADVAITTVDISQVQSAKGVYDVTFATAKGTNITVKAIVDYVNPPVFGDDEAIIADNFSLTLDEAANLTDADAVTRAGAIAWKLSDGSNVVVSSVDISQVKAVQGYYDVTFATTKGTTITVKAVVGENLVYYNVQGNNMTMTLSELQNQVVNGNLEQHVLAHTNATGTKTDITGSYSMPVTADVSNLQLVDTASSVAVVLNIDHQSGGSTMSAFANDTEVIEENATVIVDVIDDRDKNDLPSTGTSEFEMLILGGLLLAAASSVIAIIAKRKKA
ncbi:immunoglobulin-like domain-containing protein [Culicoidibacter larvae]|uniref:DUF5011 domain-containing protein n=1 Tax=Culicoidibacter larvae TaxID=2579976 RepID=A0A5R8QBM0_9FIRM|nr:immunoglobulin-like domain-containing protein [Culicoidibacter larvae]TLG73015.1 DUF5011 domain-containing protein [Culicoidibacter larvae]